MRIISVLGFLAGNAFKDVDGMLPGVHVHARRFMSVTCYCTQKIFKVFACSKARKSPQRTFREKLWWRVKHLPDLLKEVTFSNDMVAQYLILFDFRNIFSRLLDTRL